MTGKSRLTALALAGAAAVTVAGCSSVQPSIGQYAIVTGQGTFSNQQIKDVVDPGQHIKVGSGNTAWYVPSNVRNYVTGTARNSDRTNPQAELTAAKGGSPGMSVKTWTYVGFELNPSHAVIRQFFPFCLKYACATQTEQTNSSNAALTRSSNPGWLNMLDEIFPHAIDNATRQAIQDYGPSLWTTQSEWTALGDDIARDLPGQIAKLTGSGSTNYFCGPGSTPAKCLPLTVLVNNVTPTDPGVITAYNQQVSSAYSASAGRQRLAAAREVYGPDANYFLGMTDLINACKRAGVPCNIYAGNPPAHP